MKFREAIKIKAPPKAIWETLADPKMMELWNPKCTRVELDASREIGLDLEFAVSFKLNSKTSESTTRITQFQPLETIAFLHKTDLPRADSRISEIFVISSIGPQRSKVRHTIDMTDSGLPLWVRLLMRFIYRFGTPVKKSYSSLETLKVLIENELGD